MTRRGGRAPGGSKHPAARGPRGAGSWGGDTYTAKARSEGYPARSVYKLQEIDRRTGLFHSSDRVLDLGAVPGSWTLYAAEKVGPKGLVVGLDTQTFAGALPPHASIVLADAFAADLSHVLPSDARFDVVLSDMAPQTTGQPQADAVRSQALALRALALAQKHLKDRGAFVAKIFQGADFPEAKAALKATFREARVLRPKAIRSQSVEVFLFGRGLLRAPC